MDGPLPKARPGKNGITKLWLPAHPLKKAQKSTETEQAKQPAKLLQRTSTAIDSSNEVRESVASRDDIKESEEKVVSMAAASIAPLTDANDLDWLATYMQNDSPTPDAPKPELAHPVTAQVGQDNLCYLDQRCMLTSDVPAAHLG